MKKNTYRLSDYSVLINILIFLSSISSLYSQISRDLRWELGDNEEITWNLDEKSSLPHKDHIEMAGQSVDMILEWEVDENKHFSAVRVIRWPMLRTIPDDTHASLQRKISDHRGNSPKINGEIISRGIIKKVNILGAFSTVTEHKEGVEIIRTIFPSVSSPAILEKFEITNNTERTIEVSIPSWKEREETPQDNGIFGSYVVEQFIVGEGEYHVVPGQTLEYGIVYTAQKMSDPTYFGNLSAEWAARNDFIQEISNKLVLKTPDPVINRLFKFSKIRASESIFSTRGGLMHGPGGYNKYLAAIWANDQAEYINPFFPFLGNAAGNESAMNSFRHFASYMNPELLPIPSSIVSEGRDFWNGAGDRGDMAMIAYGAARFALASGNEKYGQELWPLIKWCFNYLESKKLPSGSIASDSDELEGRFPAGNANLTTISLYYDALLSASYLSKALGLDDEIGKELFRKAEEVKESIAQNFEAEVEGFDTYKYYEDNDELRSWITLPLTVGIFDKAEGTVKALFSPRLWTDYGLLTKSGTETVWDRSTLYALKGVFQAGYADKGLEKIKMFSETRLLGEHVPYVIEATSEQNQSHLSAESGLYARIFIEGIFGIRPTSFSSFESTPSLPKNWNNISLENIKAFGMVWDMQLLREKEQIRIIIKDKSDKVVYNKKLKEGKVHKIDLIN